MPKTSRPKIRAGTWNMRNIPASTMKQARIMAAVEGRSIRSLLIELIRLRWQEWARQGVAPFALDSLTAKPNHTQEKQRRTEKEPKPRVALRAIRATKAGGRDRRGCMSERAANPALRTGSASVEFAA